MINRFVKERDGSCRQAAVFVFHGVTACDNDYGNVFSFIHPPQPIHNEKSVPANAATVGYIRWKVNVEQDQIGPFPPRSADGFPTIERGKNIEAMRLEFNGVCLQQDAVIIDE